MIKLYQGAGPSEHTKVEAKSFAKKVGDLKENTFRYLDSSQFCLNSRINPSFMENYQYNFDDFLIGYKSIAYWQNQDGLDNGCIAVSIPSKDRSVEEISEILPDIATTFTQDIFSELGIEEELNYSIEDIDVQSIPQIDSIDGTIEEYSIDMICVTIQHNELNATMKWYASGTEDFLNAYGCVYNENDPTIFQNSALIGTLLLPKERRLETDLDIELKVIGGLDWDILNQDVIQFYTSPVFDNDSVLQLDTTEADIDGTIILSENTQFTVPEGIVEITMGQSPHHVVKQPTADKWIPVESNFSNNWDDQFYYTKVNDVEKVKGRFERPNNTFLYFESTTELGFVGNDNYYRLVNTLNDIKTTNVSIPRVLANTVLQ